MQWQLEPLSQVVGSASGGGGRDGGIKLDFWVG